MVKSLSHAVTHRRSGVPLLIATLLFSTVAMAEPMSPTTSTGDCFEQAARRLALSQATCAASYPAYTALYSECLRRAYVDYANGTAACQQGAVVLPPRGQSIVKGTQVRQPTSRSVLSR